MQDSAEKRLAAAITKDKRERSKTYREISDESKAAAITADIQFKTRGLKAAAGRGKVDFNSLEDVRRRTEEYFSACAQAAAIPSVQGLATFGYGISRAALYKHINNHPGTPVVEYIDTARDTIADALLSAGLRRDADSACAIFVLKNNHNFSDRLQIEPIPSDPLLGPVQDQEALQKRILESVVCEEWEDE